MKRWFAVLMILTLLCSAMPAFAATVDCASGNHDWEMGDVHQRPTCTEDAYYMLECRVCGATEKVVTEKATDHDWGKWEVTKEATCTEEGERRRICKVCEKKKKEKIDKLPHTWGDETILRESTDFSTGLRSHTCTECGTSAEEEFYPEGTLKRGDKGDKVKELQEKLNAAGYDCGKADGDYGKKTANAVRALEKDLGLEEDGIAWPGVQNRLGGDVTAYGGGFADDYVFSGDPSELLYIQTLLADEGYMSFDQATGEWNEETAEAIVARTGTAMEPDIALLGILIESMVVRYSDEPMYIICFENGVCADCTLYMQEDYYDQGGGKHLKEVYVRTVYMINGLYEVDYTLETPCLAESVIEECTLRNGVNCAYCGYSIGIAVEAVYIDLKEPVIGEVPAKSVKVITAESKAIKGGSVTLPITDWEKSLDGENYVSNGYAPFEAGYTYAPCIDLSGIPYAKGFLPVTDLLILYVNGVPMNYAMKGNWDISRRLRFKLGEWHDITVFVQDAKKTALTLHTNAFGCLDALPTEAEYPYPGKQFKGFVLYDDTPVDETTVFTKDTTICGVWSDDPDTVRIEFKVCGTIVPELTQVLPIGGCLKTLPIHADQRFGLLAWQWYDNGNRVYAGTHFSEDTVLYGSACPFRYRTTTKDCVLYDANNSMTGVRTLPAGTYLPVVDGTGNYYIVLWDNSVRYRVSKNAFDPEEQTIWPIYFDGIGFELSNTLIYTDEHGRLTSIPEITLPEGVEFIGWYTSSYADENYRVNVGDVFTCGTTVHAVCNDTRFTTMWKPVVGWKPVYTEPDSDSEIVGYLENGADYTELESHGDYWKKIETADCTGWAYFNGEQETIEATYTTDTDADVYYAPDSGSAVIGSIKSGETVVVLDITEAEGSQWYKIRYQNGIGYVCGNMTPVEPRIYRITLDPGSDSGLSPIVRNTDPDGHLRNFYFDGLEAQDGDRIVWFLEENGMKYAVDPLFEFTGDATISPMFSGASVPKIQVNMYYQDSLYRQWSIEPDQWIELPVLIDETKVEWHFGKYGASVPLSQYVGMLYTEDTDLYAYPINYGTWRQTGFECVVSSATGHPYEILEAGTPLKVFDIDGQNAEVLYNGRIAYVPASAFKPEGDVVTVYFEPCGGTFKYTSVVADFKKVYMYVENLWGGAKGSGPIPEREGYTFVGWALNNKIPNEYCFGGDAVLTAVWEPKTVNIKFDTQCKVTIEPMHVRTDDTSYELPVPERKGYRFVAWTTADGGVFAGGVPITSDLKLIASWEATNPGYSITFDASAKGGNGYVVSGKGASAEYAHTMTFVTGPDGMLKKFPSAVYDCDYPNDSTYKFEGWYTASGKKVTKATEFEESTVLYAQWSVSATVTRLEN